MGVGEGHLNRQRFADYIVCEGVADEHGKAVRFRVPASTPATLERAKAPIARTPGFQMHIFLKIVFRNSRAGLGPKENVSFTVQVFEPTRSVHFFLHGLVGGR